MEKNRLDLLVEIQESLDKRTDEYVNSCVRIQKMLHIFCKEASLFFFFLLPFIAGFVIKLMNYGATKGVFMYGLICLIVYPVFFHIFIKKLLFSDIDKDRREIEDRLDMLIRYKNNRISNKKSQV